MTIQNPRELREQFRCLNRTQREKILCAMIRINYGTAWAGDKELLQDFLPKAHHNNFHAGCLYPLIDFLTPYSEDPTHYGFKYHAVNANPSYEESTLLWESLSDPPFELTMDLPVDYSRVNK